MPALAPTRQAVKSGEVEAMPRVPAVDPALQQALANMQRVQQPRGCWQGEVEWNPMITAQVVFARHILGRPASPADQRAMLRYLESTQLDDGSWAMHPSPNAPGFVFLTAVSYVAMRLLGVSASHPRLVKAREWLSKHGGVQSVPTWGKVWLSLLGLYRWEGVNPVPPELWLLPEWSPFHPSRYYCHTRLIYLPLSALWGMRFQGAPTPTILSIRQELYGEAWDNLRFEDLRHRIAPTDVFVPPGPGLRGAYDTMVRTESLVPTALRARALQKAKRLIEVELSTTRFACISPVNGLLNLVALYAFDAHHPMVAPTIEALEVWAWRDDERGLRYQGANSHSWDTAFAVQATLAGPERAWRPLAENLMRAHSFFESTQLREPVEGGEAIWRAPATGGWCFSDDTHRWPVSDTTAEALVAVLLLEERGLAQRPLGKQRLAQAAQFILLRQNPDGGWGSYEKRRGSLLLEDINPSEMFGACMTERSYTECTASCVKALSELRKRYPDVLPAQMDRAIGRGAQFLRQRQQTNGAWSAVWAVQYTYGTLFATEALLAAGASPHDPAIRRACDWVKSVQKPDGSWGEDWRSCLEHRYMEHPQGQASMTAWAIMTLQLAQEPNPEPARRGAEFLRGLQRNDGSWPRQDVAGVFFHTAMLEYALYKDIFPTWALALMSS